MKKLILLLVLVGTLSGCTLFAAERDKLKAQVTDTVESVTKTVEEGVEQAKKTKESVEQKIEDIQNASNQVSEAVDAVKKVGE